MRRLLRRTVPGLLLVLATVGPLLPAAPAAAHPLGNFTVNRYARLEPSLGQLYVRYVLDLAEVPSLADGAQIDADPQGYADRRAAQVAEGLRLRLDGKAAPLRPEAVWLARPAGDGGLPTTRITINLRADLPGEPGSRHWISLADGSEPSRLGWREIVVAPRGGATVAGEDVPTRDLSQELREYPPDRMADPLDRREVSFTVVLGASHAPAPAADDQVAAAATGDRLAALATRPLRTPIGVALALLVAFAIGVGHAFGPGHGKTVMAAYLMGTGGRGRDAVAIGVVVSLMHTLSVLVLGTVLLSVGWAADPGRTFPWLSLASGVAVLAVGVALCRQRFRRSPEHHHHHHDDEHHDHGDEEHDHGLGPHRHVPLDAPLSWRGLLALGASGGLYPSPSALILLLAAVTLGRTELGLALVVAFSVGLATTLVGLGLLLVAGGAVVSRRRAGGWLLRWAPRAGALALLVLGLALTGRAAVDLV